MFQPSQPNSTAFPAEEYVCLDTKITNRYRSGYNMDALIVAEGQEKFEIGARNVSLYEIGKFKTEF